MILRIREIGDTSDDGACWPVPATLSGGPLFDLEQWDGSPERVRFTPITGLLEQEVLPGGARDVNKVRKIAGFAYVTDARLVVAVEKFDKGSTFVGFGGVGAAVGLAATGISKARAAQRRKGKILVGQVRWQWAKAIAAKPGSGKASDSGTIRAVCETRSGTDTRLFRLDLTVPGNIPVLEMAQDCIRRAAAWRLAYYPGREEGRDKLRELAEAPLLERPEQGRLSVYTMPNYFYFSPASAYPKQQADQLPTETTAEGAG